MYRLGILFIVLKNNDEGGEKHEVGEAVNNEEEEAYEDSGDDGERAGDDGDEEVNNAVHGVFLLFIRADIHSGYLPNTNLLYI